ncbi:MAG: hypothetical protein P8Y36_13810, partial [Alphaproteobacteria bacterium]
MRAPRWRTTFGKDVTGNQQILLADVKPPEAKIEKTSFACRYCQRCGVGSPIPLQVERRCQ